MPTDLRINGGEVLHHRHVPIFSSVPRYNIGIGNVIRELAVANMLRQTWSKDL